MSRRKQGAAQAALTFTIPQSEFDWQVQWIRDYTEEHKEDDPDLGADDLYETIGIAAEALLNEVLALQVMARLRAAVNDLEK